MAETLLLGDCRRDSVLQRAGIQDCQAILIVTGDANVNIETAIAVRRLNPTLRLVIRSGKENLNDLLKQRLKNFVSLEPTELPAATFTLAALGEETLGFFTIDRHLLRVVKHRITADDQLWLGKSVYQLHKRTQRLLNYPAITQASSRQNLTLESSESKVPSLLFHQWLPDACLKPGETITYVEEVEKLFTKPKPVKQSRFNRRQLRQTLRQLAKEPWRQNLARFWAWIYHDQTRRFVAFGSLTGGLLTLMGTIALKLTVPGMSWQSALSAAIILLLGGYGDMFGGLETSLALPWWVQFLCLMITAFSLLFIFSVLGLAADRLLRARFEFLKPRLPIPEADHVVLIGLGRVGQKIARLLLELKQPFVCLTQSSDQRDVIANVPVICDAIGRGLSEVNLSTARSVVLATEDQMLNLEAALIARDVAAQANHPINLVIRTYDQRFSEHLAGLLPETKAFCANALSAEAFVGAAFGENILSLFRLNDETVLVVEFQIEPDDTLHGKILAQVAYGYGVVPIFYQSKALGEAVFMPSDDPRLYVGDRLVVLATINGLRRIEQGVLTPCRSWQLQALMPLDSRALHYAGDVLTNVSGCSLAEARQFMNHLPGVLDIPGVMEIDLYDHQAYRLMQKLRKLLPIRLVSLSSLNQASPAAHTPIDWRSK